MEEVLNLDSTGFAPSSCILSRDLLEIGDGLLVPATKRLNDQRLEEDAFRSAVVEVRAILCGFPRFNGAGGCVRCSMKQRLLRRGNDADVKGNFPAVKPLGNEDIHGA